MGMRMKEDWPLVREALGPKEFHRRSHYSSRHYEISEKLIETPELASLIGELSTSTDDD